MTTVEEGCLKLISPANIKRPIKRQQKSITKPLYVTFNGIYLSENLPPKTLYIYIYIYIYTNLKVVITYHSRNLEFHLTQKKFG